MDGIRVILGPIVTPPLQFSILTGLLTIIFVCVFTRITTGSNARRSTAGEARAVSTLPYWVPWLGHGLSFARGGQGFLSQLSKSTKDGIFGIILRGKKYAVITAPSIIHQLEESDTMNSNTETRQYKLRHFFGARSNSSKSLEALACQNNDKLLLMGYDGESRIHKHIERMTRALEQTAYNLISFNDSWVDQSSWERTSKTILKHGSESIAEVSFFPLIERFVAELATNTLMGRNFLENNPDFVEDLGVWNSKGTSFMNQMPAFLPQMSAACAARERVLRCLKKFKQELSTYLKGHETGTDWGDLSDVSSYMKDRLKRRKCEKSPALSPHLDVYTDAAWLWAWNKPNLLISWLLYRVYTDTALVEAIRKDIEPFVRVEQLNSELPIPEPPRVIIDTNGLVKKSTLLRSAMEETLRLDTNTVTYGVMMKDVVVTESQADAASLGKETPHSYILRKGDLVCMPHRTQWTRSGPGDGPGVFNPAGFSSIANLKIPGASMVEENRIDAFGVGSLECPGKGLAEQETMTTAATILAMWNVEPVDGSWIWPGQKPALCSMLPIKDVRVKMSRRAGRRL